MTGGSPGCSHEVSKGLQMNAKRWAGITSLILLGVSLVSGAAGADPLTSPAPVAQAAPRLLLLDCTKTFASTMRVGGLAAFLRTSGAVDVVVQFGDVAGMYEVPAIQEDALQGEPFDAVIFIPRGIDDGSADSIWIITNILPDSPHQLWEQIVLLRMVINEAFTGLAHGVDSTIDLWSAFTASLYTAQGWLR